MGDPAGIGPEIAVKAWHALRHEGPAFVLIADPDCLPPEVPTTGEARLFAQALPVVPVALAAAVRAGRPDMANAGAVIESIRLAVEMSRRQPGAGRGDQPDCEIGAAGRGVSSSRAYRVPGRADRLRGPGDHDAGVADASGGAGDDPFVVAGGAGRVVGRGDRVGGADDGGCPRTRLRPGTAAAGDCRAQPSCRRGRAYGT